MRQQKEAQIQRAIVRHLHVRAKPGVVWTATANGGKRDAKTGAMLKLSGVRAGVSDILLWYGGRSYALELKANGGRLSEAQNRFLTEFDNAGGFICAAIGLDEALNTLKAWDLIA